MSAIVLASSLSARANCTIFNYPGGGNVVCYKNGALRRALGYYTQEEKDEMLHLQAQKLQDEDVLRRHGYRVGK